MAGMAAGDAARGDLIMQKSKYKISVIVPVYNKEKYVKQCIESVLAQTYGNLELLLIDDGSTDASGAICDEYAAKDVRVKVFHQENGGPMAAVMTGLREASGEYYTFIDSDDYVSEEMLEEMTKCLTGRRGEIICCNHVLEKRKSTVPVIQPRAPGVYEGASLEEDLKYKLLGREYRIIPMSRCMKLCERSIFEGNEKYYDTTLRMGDDFNLIYPALLKSTSVVVMEGALFYHYRYVEDSIVHAYDPDNAKSVINCYNALLRIVRDYHVPYGETMLNKEYCYMMMYVMKNELRNPDKDYVQKIQSIFTEKETRDRIMNTPLTVTSRSNSLLYLAMKYPNKMLLHIMWMIVKQYDAFGKKRKR